MNTLTKLPVVTLKNVKYAEFASEETSCFEATVYLDGVAFCGVSNDGHGGCDNFYSLKKDQHRGDIYERVRELDAQLAKLPPMPREPDEDEELPLLEWSMELLIGRALEVFLEERDTKRQLSRAVIFYDPARKGCYSLKNAKKASEATLRDFVAKKYPGGVVLNFIPLPEAVEYLTGRKQPGVAA